MRRPKILAEKDPIPSPAREAAINPVAFQQPLESDVAVLSKLLSETIKEHSGVAGGSPEKLDQTIQTLLSTSKAYFEDGSPENFNQCIKEITSLSSPELLEVAR